MEGTTAVRAVTGRQVWTGAELAGRDDWVWQVPASMVADLDRALAAVKERGLAIPEIGREDFPLPSVEAELRSLAREVEDGRGFLVLRGLPVRRWSYPDLRLLYWGIGTHFGRAVHQDKDGAWFIDVRDEGKAYGQNMRGYHGHDLLHFHSDGANVVALLCINTAMSGGISTLVSAGAIHNRLLEQHPEALAPLYDGFPADRRGAEPKGEPRLSPWRVPVFGWAGDRFACVYARSTHVWGCELAGRPMSAVEAAAFDAFDRLAHDPGMRLDMELQPGDIQLVNNFTVLHSRTEFEDWPEPERRRHLLRLWLEVPESRRAAINKLHLYTRAPLPAGIPIRPA